MCIGVYICAYARPRAMFEFGACACSSATSWPPFAYVIWLDRHTHARKHRPRFTVITSCWVRVCVCVLLEFIACARAHTSAIPGTRIFTHTHTYTYIYMPRTVEETRGIFRVRATVIEMGIRLQPTRERKAAGGVRRQRRHLITISARTHTHTRVINRCAL